MPGPTASSSATSCSPHRTPATRTTTRSSSVSVRGSPRNPSSGDGGRAGDGAPVTSWVERDAAVVWHGFTQMSTHAENLPLIVESGEGRELIDILGNRYLDAISSLWVMTRGHRVPELDEALKAQVDRIAHSTMLGNG